MILKLLGLYVEGLLHLQVSVLTVPLRPADRLLHITADDVIPPEKRRLLEDTPPDHHLVTELMIAGAVDHVVLFSRAEEEADHTRDLLVLIAAVEGNQLTGAEKVAPLLLLDEDLQADQEVLLAGEGVFPGRLLLVAAPPEVPQAALSLIKQPHSQPRIHFLP